MPKTMLLVTLLLGGCTREQALAQAKKNEARAEEKVAHEQSALATRQEQQRDALAQAQVKDQVALEAKQDEQLARLDRKQQEEQAALEADHRTLLATGKSRLMRAGVQMAEARVKVEAGARERLEKIEARA